MSDRLTEIEAAFAIALEGSWRTADVETAALGYLLDVVKAAQKVDDAYTEFIESGVLDSLAEAVGDLRTALSRLGRR